MEVPVLLRGLEFGTIGEDDEREPLAVERRSSSEQRYERVRVRIDPAVHETVERQELPDLSRARGRAPSDNRGCRCSPAETAPLADRVIKPALFPGDRRATRSRSLDPQVTSDLVASPSVERQVGPDDRSEARLAVEPQRSAEGLDAVGESADSGALAQIHTATAVVPDLDADFVGCR